MSNLLKSGFINFRKEEAKIIDSNEIVAERLRQLGFQALSHPAESPSGGGAGAAQDSDMDEEKAGALFGGEGGALYREAPAYEGPSPEELLETAKAEIEEMKAAAAEEAEALRKQAAEEGRQAGFDDGFARGRAEALQEAEKAERRAEEQIQETQALREKLRREYEEKLQEMEPMVIDELTAIYDHIFEAGLKDRKEIIFHLLDTTLHRIDSGREFIVRVSQTDYEYVAARKEELVAGMPGVRVDLVADVTMKRGEGMIETGGGLFDCSVDVELRELKRRIHVLAYQKE